MECLDNIYVWVGAAKHAPRCWCYHGADAASLRDLHLFEEARSLLRETIPTAQRVLGEDYYLTLMMKQKCAQSLYRDDGATLDDLREALTTLEEIGRIAQRVLGDRHPTTEEIEGDVERSRAALRTRETPPLP